MVGQTPKQPESLTGSTFHAIVISPNTGTLPPGGFDAFGSPVVLYVIRMSPVMKPNRGAFRRDPHPFQRPGRIEQLQGALVRLGGRSWSPTRPAGGRAKPRDRSGAR